MFDKTSVSTSFAGRELILETGERARQASGAVTAIYGDTVVLCAAVIEDHPNPDVGFLPLRIDFEEKMYAVGRIPGGFFKREGKPSGDATQVARSIDRPIRPLLPSGLRNEVQVICTPLSAENQNSAEIVAMTGAAAAMHLTPAPFEGPFACAQVGWLDGELILNPSFEEREEGRMDLTVAAGPMGVLQVELGGDEVPEEIVLQGIRMAHAACLPVCEAIEELRDKAGKPKREYPLWEPAPEVNDAVLERTEDIREAIQSPDKEGRQRDLDRIAEEIAEKFQDLEDAPQQVQEAMYEVQKQQMRKILLEERRRVDGRGPKDIRPLDVKAGLLPRTHGSGQFTRGETQVLSTVTLGATRDQKLIRTLEEEEYHRFMHHYNFPPFCVGETRALRGASRREIGHGALVQRSLERMLLPEEQWPYTTRVVSEVLESNGSSSMASACASSLALMDAGVPVKTQVAGISVGLLYESEDNYILLTDIQGLEDAAGDMDFKVTGTESGVNGLHLDIKVKGLPEAVLAEGLQQAREARLQILERMNEVISAPRETLSPYAPRMVAIKVPVDKIGLVIGPGGKTIRKFETELDVSIDVEDDGVVKIFGENAENVEKVKAAIHDLTREVEVGEVFTGKVVTITDFGAFVEVLPGRDGLLHISDIEHQRTNKVEDVLSLGDEVTVKVTEVESDDKIRLSRKALLDRGGGNGGRKGGGGGGKSRDKRGGKSRSKQQDSKQREKPQNSDSEGPASGAYFRDKKS
ncbi:MAG: polyribonucleotide nucleotidyltransferase [Armatimonadota bacterium]|nr:polyribonucleotide nucleotidyltransferase [Armatimonadota bacterium]